MKTGAPGFGFLALCSRSKLVDIRGRNAVAKGDVVEVLERGDLGGARSRRVGPVGEDIVERAC